VSNLKLIRFAAWGTLALVAILTLAPIGFRPSSTLPTTIERFVAFTAIGFAFALAYPKQFWLAAFVAIGAALALEALQVLAPTRHGRLFDAAVKLAGGTVGLLLGLAWQRHAAATGLRLAGSVQDLVARLRNLG
jgi:hypothetical protein